jgi:peptidyl-prolyl cis-trans isomerase SurA
MKRSSLAVLLACSAVCLWAHAQGLRTPANRPSGADASWSLPLASTSRSADYIVAIVNAEPITNLQVNAEVERVRRQFQAQQRALPEASMLSRQILERLVNEKTQLQLARDYGFKIEEASIAQAEQNVASQNQLTLDQLYKELEREGLSRQRFRDQLRDQLLLRRLYDAEVEPRVRVSDVEVDQYLAEQKMRSQDPANTQLSMAHLLIAVPDDASESEVAKLKDKAQQALTRARAGEDFAALVREYSEAGDRNNGGQLGVRTADRYPPLFVEATRNAQLGEVVGPVRSGAGFHVIKLLERATPGLPPTTVVQSHARHILLVPSSQLSEAQAVERLKDYKRRIESGSADFAALAKQFSQDGSAAEGGDLGWSYPGMFVPEFERVLDQLAPHQLSQPLISRFGVHLIELMERRRATLTEREQRETVRGMLREKKYGEVFENWVRDVRARAYVEFRDAPQL